MANEITPEEQHELNERARTDTRELANLIAMAGDGWKFSDDYLGKIVINYLPALKRNLEKLRAAVPEEGTLLYAERYRKLRIAADREWVDWHDGAERHHAGCGEELDRMLDMNNGEASK